MRIITDYRDIDPVLRGASVAIGNFDGVHKGHRELWHTAQRKGDPAGVVTFQPHPRRLFQPAAPPFLLTRPEEKARILRTAGVDVLFSLPFDAAMSSMAAEDFVTDVLASGLHLSHIVVGADFRFGKGRQGDAKMLRSMGPELGFTVTIHDLIGDESGEYASSAIRVMLQEGRCRDAGNALGRWHSVTGPVVKGDQRGRDLGYPTANLTFGEQLIPRYGVYATYVSILDEPQTRLRPGVASIGERPTFGVNAPNFEVHLFDFNEDLYGREIVVSLIEYLRPEVAYVDAPTLIAQMDRDSEQARAILARRPMLS